MDIAGDMIGEDEIDRTYAWQEVAKDLALIAAGYAPKHLQALIDNPVS